MLPPDRREWQPIYPNLVKSAASFCHQVAAWVLGMFCSFCIVKNNKTANNSTTTKATDI